MLTIKYISLVNKIESYAPLVRAVYLRLQLPHLNMAYGAFQYWHHARHTSQMLWLQTKSVVTQILNRTAGRAASEIYRDVAPARRNTEKGSKRRGMRICTVDRSAR